MPPRSEDAFEAYAHAFILAVLAFGFIVGLGVARVAGSP